MYFIREWILNTHFLFTIWISFLANPSFALRVRVTSLFCAHFFTLRGVFFPFFRRHSAQLEDRRAQSFRFVVIVYVFSYFLSFWFLSLSLSPSVSRLLFIVCGAVHAQIRWLFKNRTNWWDYFCAHLDDVVDDCALFFVIHQVHTSRRTLMTTEDAADKCTVVGITSRQWIKRSVTTSHLFQFSFVLVSLLSCLHLRQSKATIVTAETRVPSFLTFVYIFLQKSDVCQSCSWSSNFVSLVSSILLEVSRKMKQEKGQFSLSSTVIYSCSHCVGDFSNENQFTQSIELITTWQLDYVIHFIKHYRRHHTSVFRRVVRACSFGWMGIRKSHRRVIFSLASWISTKFSSLICVAWSMMIRSKC